MAIIGNIITAPIPITSIILPSPDPTYIFGLRQEAGELSSPIGARSSLRP